FHAHSKGDLSPSHISSDSRIHTGAIQTFSFLMVNDRDGLTPQQLEKEYHFMVGKHLPLQILGYQSTMELVLQMPDVISVCPCWDGSVILKGIPDESTQGIASLVARQRSRHKIRNSSQMGRATVCSGPHSRPLVPYRGRVPPVLPAVVKGNIFTQPFRMKPESYPTGTPVVKARFSQPTANMEPPKQTLNMEKTFKSNALETSRLNHTEKLN
ncbi:hypothetical protein MC885_005826, partial [Smutsia gigantea]